jgi:hypothetical protein
VRTTDSRSRAPDGRLPHFLHALRTLAVARVPAHRRNVESLYTGEMQLIESTWRAALEGAGGFLPVQDAQAQLQRVLRAYSAEFRPQTGDDFAFPLLEVLHFVEVELGLKARCSEAFALNRVEYDFGWCAVGCLDRAAVSFRTRADAYRTLVEQERRDVLRGAPGAEERLARLALAWAALVSHDDFAADRAAAAGELLQVAESAQAALTQIQSGGAGAGASAGAGAGADPPREVKRALDELARCIDALKPAAQSAAQVRYGARVPFAF